MKKCISIFAEWQVIMLVLVVIGTNLSAPAYCQANDVALLLQQTPLQGGTITPDMGVHGFLPGTEVTLTAVPKPGYQFVCWIGDVGDTTANRTSVYLDTPKIVIAVFERAEYEFLAMDELPRGGGHGGLHSSSADYSRQGGGGGGGRRPHKRYGTSQEKPDEEPTNDFPVPEKSEEELNDFPVPQPIPEPAAIFLLGSGALMLRRKRKQKQK